MGHIQLSAKVKTQKKVFLLDAPLLERDHLTNILNNSGYSVSVYTTPAEFFKDKIRESDSQAVLVSNIRLPSLSGVALLERLRINNSRLPVVFYGGATNVPQGVEAVKKGAVNFLLSPINKDTLIDALEDSFKLIKKVSKNWRCPL